MIEKFLIACEGELDKLLVNKIKDLIYVSTGNPRVQSIIVNKTKGNSEVLKTIRNFKGNCIGVIDNDKRIPDSVKFFEPCKNIDVDYFYNKISLKLSFRRDNEKLKYLIVINPAIEKWLDYCLEYFSKKRSDYNLPENDAEYRNITKRRELDESLFGKLIKDTLNKSIQGRSLKFIIRKALEYHSFSA